MQYGYNFNIVLYSMISMQFYIVFIVKTFSCTNAIELNLFYYLNDKTVSLI